MEERHSQVQVGKGLEESRLNVEFIEFLKKWSTPALVVVAAIALGYFGLLKYREYDKKVHEDAFAQLEEAAISGSPASLLAVAEEHPDRAAIAELARLYAADIHLDSARSGLAPGTALDPSTGKPAETDILTPEQKEQQLASAEKLYQAVVDRTIDKTVERQLAIGGLYGLAAIAETRAELDDARRYYERIIEVAKQADMPAEAKRAQSRLDSITTLGALPQLYTQADLPQLPASANPGVLTPVSPPSLGSTPDGLPLPETIPTDVGGEQGPTPEGTPLPLPGEEGPAGPVPAPAPTQPKPGEGTPSDQPASPPAPAPPPGG